jgi:hypothetical protein
MALSTKQVYIDTTKLSGTKIPTGHGVAIAEAALGTPDITETFEWDLLASDSVAATAILGFNDLLNTELVADIDAFIAANTGLGINITAHTVSYNAKVTDIKYGDGTDIYLTSTLVSFKVSFELRVYVSA